MTDAVPGPKCTRVTIMMVMSDGSSSVIDIREPRSEPSTILETDPDESEHLFNYSSTMAVTHRRNGYKFHLDVVLGDAGAIVTTSPLFSALEERDELSG